MTQRIDYQKQSSVDMHVKAATMHGERPLRLHHVAVWCESTLFSSRVVPGPYDRAFGVDKSGLS